MTKSGSKKVGKVVNYDPHGEYQLLTVPGNHTLGLWGSPKKDAGNSAEKAESASAATYISPPILSLEWPGSVRFLEFPRVRGERRNLQRSQRSTPSEAQKLRRLRRNQQRRLERSNLVSCDLIKLV